MISLSNDQLNQLINDTRAELVYRLMTEHRDNLELLTPIEVCALLGITQPTLAKLKDGPPRVSLIVNGIIRYRAVDVADYIKRRMPATN